LGDATAAFELGTLYSLDGDARDGAAALRWFRKGAEAGCVEAAKKLVEFYRDGNADLNVEPNAAEAERWRRVADGKDAATDERPEGTAANQTGAERGARRERF
jgi:TPR repeat protein